MKETEELTEDKDTYEELDYSSDDMRAFMGERLIEVIKREGYATAVILIENGADLEMQNTKGEKALTEACKRDNLFIVKTLLEKGVKLEPNETLDIWKKWAEDQEIQGKIYKYIEFNTETQTELLEQAIKQNRIILILGLENYSIKLLKNAIKDKPINEVVAIIKENIELYENTGRSLELLDCPEKDDLRKVSSFIEHCASLEIINGKGGKALTEAYERDNLFIVKALLKQGVKPKPNEALNIWRKWAEDYDVRKIIYKYIEFSAETEIELLEQALREDRISLILDLENYSIKLLRDAVKGKSINKIVSIIKENIKSYEDTQGLKLLECLEKDDLIDVVELIEEDTNLELKNSNSETALDIAKRKNYKDIEQLLVFKIIKTMFEEDLTLQTLTYDKIVSKLNEIHSLEIFEKKLDDSLILDVIQLPQINDEQKLQIIDILISKSPNLKLEDELGNNILHYLMIGDEISAIDKQFIIAVIKKLIEVDNSILNQTNIDGMTPFAKVVELANIEIVEALLEAGANPNEVIDKSKLYKLIEEAIKNIAIEYNGVKLVKLLIEYGAVVNRDIKIGLKEWVKIAEEGSLKELFENRLEITERERENLLELAVSRDNPNLIPSDLKRYGSFTLYNILEKAEKSNVSNKVIKLIAKFIEENKASGEALIHTLDNSIYHPSWPDMIKNFIAQKSWLNYQDKDGKTILHYACKSSRDNDILRMLIESGANPNINSIEGENSLNSLNSQELEIIKLLLQARTDISVRKVDSLILVACPDQDKIKLLKELSKINFIIDRNKYNSYVSCGFSQRFPEAIKFLLEIREDKLLEISILFNDSMIAKIIEEHLKRISDDKNYALKIAVCKEDRNLVKNLLKEGANPNWQDDYGYTALHWATCKNNIEITQLLVKAKADPNIRDAERESALDIAIAYNKPGIVKFLLTNCVIEFSQEVALELLYKFADYQEIKSILYAKIDFTTEVLTKLLNDSIIENRLELLVDLSFYEVEQLENSIKNITNKNNVVAYVANYIEEHHKQKGLELIEAIKANDIDRSINLIKDGANLTVESDSKEIAINVAYQLENSTIIKLLLANNLIPTQEQAIKIWHKFAEDSEVKNAIFLHINFTPEIHQDLLNGAILEDRVALITDLKYYDIKELRKIVENSATNKVIISIRNFVEEYDKQKGLELIEAIKANNTDTAINLIKDGANLTVENELKETAINVAYQFENSTIIKLLLVNNLLPTQEQAIEIWHKFAEDSEVKNAIFPHINFTPEIHRDLLNKAISEDRVELMADITHYKITELRKIVENSATNKVIISIRNFVEEYDKQKGLELIEAIKINNTDTAINLIEENANLYIKNAEDKTCLELAKEYRLSVVEQGIALKRIKNEVKRQDNLDSVNKSQNIIKLFEDISSLNSTEKNLEDNLLLEIIKDNVLKSDEKLKIIELIISKSPNLKLKDEPGNNILHYLTIVNEVSATDKKFIATVIKKLIKADNSILNQTNNEGMTPVAKAVEFVNIDIVQALLEVGADVNGKMHTGRVRNLLEEAISLLPIEEQAIEIVKLLLRHKAKINYNVKIGFKEWYRISQDAELKEIFENRLKLTEKEKEDLLELAVTKDNLDLLPSDLKICGSYDLKRLLTNTKTCGINNKVTKKIEEFINKNEALGKELLEALKVNNDDLRISKIKNLIAQNVWLNYQDKTGETILYKSCQNDCYKEVADILIGAGANIEQADKNGQAPLFWAVWGHTEIVKSLLKSGASANTKCLANQRGIYWALEGGHFEIVKELIKAGVDVNYTGHYVALEVAIKKNNIESVKLLLAAGANPLLKNNNDTALDHAQKNNKEDIVKIIENHIEKIKSDQEYALRIAICQGDTEQTRDLLAARINPNGQDDYGYTALHWAVFKGNIEIFRMLLIAGADLYSLDNEGKNVIDYIIENNKVKFLEIILDNNISPNSLLNAGKAMLHIAVELNNIIITEMLLDNGADVNLSTESGVRPLELAVERKVETITEMLLNKGANPNITFTNGKYALHNAIVSKSTQLVQMLLDNGADVNLSTESGVRPLELAVERKVETITEMLLNKGANPNITFTNGKYALHNAIVSKSTQLVQMLLDNSADANLSTESGVTPLELAVENGAETITEMLLSKGTKINVKFTNGKYALHNAIVNKNLKLAKMLLDNGADVNLSTESGVRPLELAVENGAETITEMLLNKGGNPNVKFTNGKNALHNAIVSKSTQLVQMLLDNGADVNLSTESGVTPLELAVENGAETITEMLLSKGTKINVKFTNGKYALHNAIVNKNLKLAKMLLDNGADVNLSTESGVRPLELAVENGAETITEMLLNKGGNPNVKFTNGKNALHNAIVSKSTQLVQMLLDNGADVNLSTESGVTPLELVVENGAETITEMLLNKGANPNVKFTNGKYALYNAILKRNYKFVQMLLDNGADVNLSTESGVTPLELVVENGAETITEMLLSKGANPNVKFMNGKYALHNAIVNKNLKLAKMLLDNGADVNLSTESGVTPLELAVENGTETITEMLLSKGAKINTATKNNVPILSLAITSNNFNIVKSLLTKGVSAKLKYYNPLRQANALAYKSSNWSEWFESFIERTDNYKIYNLIKDRLHISKIIEKKIDHEIDFKLRYFARKLNHSNIEKLIKSTKLQEFIDDKNFHNLAMKIIHNQKFSRFDNIKAYFYGKETISSQLLIKSLKNKIQNSDLYQERFLELVNNSMAEREDKLIYDKNDLEYENWNIYRNIGWVKYLKSFILKVTEYDIYYKIKKNIDQITKQEAKLNNQITEKFADCIEMVIDNAEMNNAVKACKLTKYVNEENYEKIKSYSRRIKPIEAGIKGVVQSIIYGSEASQRKSLAINLKRELKQDTSFRTEFDKNIYDRMKKSGISSLG